jgi:hypothetical protein
LSKQKRNDRSKQKRSLTIPRVQIREELHERRRENRWRVQFGARWIDIAPECHFLTIHNLSASGFLFETELPLRTGSYLVVEMPDQISKFCRTVWTSGPLHGATFSEPLSDRELRVLTSASSLVQPSFGGRTTSAVIEQSTDPPLPILDERSLADSKKFPAVIRWTIFVGASIALWALVGAGIWLTSR